MIAAANLLRMIEAPSLSWSIWKHFDLDFDLEIGFWGIRCLISFPMPFWISMLEIEEGSVPSFFTLANSRGFGDSLFDIPFLRLSEYQCPIKLYFR